VPTVRKRRTVHPHRFTPRVVDMLLDPQPDPIILSERLQLGRGETLMDALPTAGQAGPRAPQPRSAGNLPQPRAADPGLAARGAGALRSRLALMGTNRRRRAPARIAPTAEMVAAWRAGDADVLKQLIRTVPPGCPPWRWSKGTIEHGDRGNNSSLAMARALVAAAGCHFGGG
jgi:hypothetical protein